MRLLASLALLLAFSGGHTWTAEPTSSPLPENVTQAMSKLVGTFTISGVRNGEPFTGLYQARWNDHRSGLIHVYHEGQERSHAVSYWDPDKQQIVETWAGKTLNAIHRYKIESDTSWSGTTTLMMHDGERFEGSAKVQMDDKGGFTFTGNAGKETLTVKDVRVPLSKSIESLQTFGKLMVGGTWVNEADGKESKHKYRWANQRQALVLDREGGDLPGASFVSLDHASQCIRWTEVDTNRVSGTTIMVPAGKNQWLYYGHYQGPDDADQRLSLTIEKVGPDEIHSNGTLVNDGVEQKWAMAVWKRQRTKK